MKNQPSNHPSQKKAIIQIQNLSFSYQGQNEVLKDINFDIYEEDFLGLIGPNGGGKSTLLKLIIGLLPFKKGNIRIFSQDLKEFKDWHLIGYVSQKATHFENRFPATVEEIIWMSMAKTKKLFRLSRSAQKERVEQVLNDVGMLKHRKTSIHNLSGGQQQRVFIARALATNPRILVLDEPTVGIDVKAQEGFYHLLQKLRQEKKLTIILVSHDIDVVATQVNSFACLNQSLIYHGEPEEFIKHDYIEKLYGKDLRLILHGH